MTPSLQITLALIGLIVIISVCIPVWKKSRSEKDKLKYQRPNQNSIKNFDLEIKKFLSHQSSVSIKVIKWPLHFFKA